MTTGPGHWSARVRAAYSEAFDSTAAVEDGFGPIVVDVPVDRWLEALSLARDVLDCAFFDFLTAVDERSPQPVEGLDDGFRMVCHVADHRSPGPGHGVSHLIVRTLLPPQAPVVASAAGVYAGAGWHERETHEMFGVDFTVDGTVQVLAKLLLPEEFEGHPLRKDFVLASRVAKPWPGAKEPGESDLQQPGTAPSRRRVRPPGVPAPEAWGPRPAGSGASGASGAPGAVDG